MIDGIERIILGRREILFKFSSEHPLIVKLFMLKYLFDMYDVPSELEEELYYDVYKKYIEVTLGLKYKKHYDYLPKFSIKIKKDNLDTSLSCYVMYITANIELTHKGLNLLKLKKPKLWKAYHPNRFHGPLVVEHLDQAKQYYYNNIEHLYDRQFHIHRKDILSRAVKEDFRNILNDIKYIKRLKEIYEQKAAIEN